MDFSTTTSISLLEGLRIPGNSSWEEFASRYTPILIAFGRKRGLAESDSEDVAQKSLLAFLEGYLGGRYDPTQGGLRSWLFGIAHRKVCDALKDRARKAQSFGGSTDSTAFDPPEKAAPESWGTWTREWADAIFNACMDECRKSFDAKTMDAFTLHAWKGQPAKEVGSLLGISENAVYLAKHRVTKRIRSLLPEISKRF